MRKNRIPFALLLLLAAACGKEYPNYIEDPDYVIQSDKSLFAVYPVAVSIPSVGGEFEVEVTGNEEWTASLVESNSSAQDWCVLDKTSGSGAGVIKGTVTASTSFVKNRSVVIEITNGDKTLRSKVIQATQVLGDGEVLIDGVIWATCNVGAPGTFAESMDEVGMLYQFNRKDGYSFASSVPEFASAYSSYSPSEQGWVTSGWTEENDPCPEGWRVPTGQEVCDLMGDSQDNLKAVWVEQSTGRFGRTGFICGLDANMASSATSENITSLGGIFIPMSGWLTEGGTLDRNWLVVIRTATSLNDSMGGMFLSGYGYTDAWGWGDGHKNRAAPVRCVKKIVIED